MFFFFFSLSLSISKRVSICTEKKKNSILRIPQREKVTNKNRYNNPVFNPVDTTYTRVEIREYFFFSLSNFERGKFCKVFPRVYTVNRYVIHFYTINKIRTLYPRVALCIEIVSFVFHVNERENKRYVVIFWNMKALSVVYLHVCLTKFHRVHVIK